MILLLRRVPWVEVTIELPVLTILRESRVFSKHDIVSFNHCLRLSLILLILIRLNRLLLIILILVSWVVLLLPLRELLIVPSLFIFGVLSFLSPFSSIFLIVVFLVAIILVYPVLVKVTPISTRTLVKIVLIIFLSILGINRSRWILMPLIGIFSSLSLLRVILVGLKLNVLLLFEKLLLVIDDLHLTFKHLVQLVVLFFVLDPLNEFW